MIICHLVWLLFPIDIKWSVNMQMLLCYSTEEKNMGMGLNLLPHEHKWYFYTFERKCHSHYHDSRVPPIMLPSRKQIEEGRYEPSRLQDHETCDDWLTRALMYSCRIPTHCGIERNNKSTKITKDALNNDIDRLMEVRHADLNPRANAYAHHLTTDQRRHGDTRKTFGYQYIDQNF